MPDQNADIIASIAAQRLGPAPAPVPQMPPPQAQPMATPPPPKADAAPTDIERAQSKVAPNEPGEDGSATDMKFISIGGRDYTESQLAGTLARYPKANATVQMNKPILDLAQQIMDSARANGHDPQPHEVAGLMDAALKAFVKNPQMGGKKQGKDGQGDSQPTGGDLADQDEVFSQWEKENAVKLPPGFREMGSKMQQMMQLIEQMAKNGMNNGQAQQQAAQTMQAAQQTHQVAQAVQGDAVTRMISTNLNAAFQQAQLPMDPQSRSDFQMFAAQRGYDFPDFVDPEMTRTVVADFKAVKDAPEMQRLRGVMSKRQAFTGSLDSAPGAGGAAPAPAGDPMLAKLVDAAMSKRNM